MHLMSFIAVMVLLLAAVSVTGFWLLRAAKRQQHKRMTGLLQHFSHLGTEYGLRFSGQDTLQNRIIGLDGIHGMLLVMMHDDKGNIMGEEVLHLDDVKSCDVLKIYHHIGSQKKQEDLQKIILLFKSNKRPPVEILFYHHRHNSIDDVTKMETKAKHWETILRKMMRREVSRVA